MTGAAFLCSIVPLGVSIGASISLVDSPEMVRIPGV